MLSPMKHRHSPRPGQRSPRTPRIALLSLALGAASACADDGRGEPNAAVDATSDAAVDTRPDAAIDGAPDVEAEVDTGPPLDPSCRNPGTDAATASCLAPTLPPEYYVEQGDAYFDTLDVRPEYDRVPLYSDLVARYEWPPWLLLTGYTRENMIQIEEALASLDPSTTPERDCRYFPVNPFARCFVVIEYEEGPCPIYEEFTFNPQGEMTFVEAWSDIPGLLPQDREADPWAEDPAFPRLATPIPGLGNAEGRIDLDSQAMRDAEAADPDVADFARRARDFWPTWYEALAAAPRDFFAVGCGWSEPR
jgi:hypothetical protein